MVRHESEETSPAAAATSPVGTPEDLDLRNQVTNHTGDRSVSDWIAALKAKLARLRLKRSNLKLGLVATNRRIARAQMKLMDLQAQIPKKPVGRPRVRPLEPVRPKKPIGRPPLIAKKLTRLRSLIEVKEKAIRMSLRDFPDGNPVMEEMKAELASLIAEEDRLLSLKAAGQVQAW